MNNYSWYHLIPAPYSKFPSYRTLGNVLFPNQDPIKEQILQCLSDRPPHLFKFLQNEEIRLSVVQNALHFISCLFLVSSNLYFLYSRGERTWSLLTFPVSPEAPECLRKFHSIPKLNKQKFNYSIYLKGPNNFIIIFA